MNKKKVVFSILLVMIIASVLFLYNAFNGNPISKFISKGVLENHLEVNYPDRELQIEEGFYNFKFSEYQFNVIEIGSIDEKRNVKEYEFNVRGTFNPTVSWDGIYYESLDEEMAERLSKEAHEEIVPLLEDEIDTIHQIEFRIEVLKGKFDKDVQWSKNLVFDKPMEIFVQFNSTEQTKEDFVSEAVKVKGILDQQGYEYESIVFNGSGFDQDEFKINTQGYLKYGFRVDKDENIEMKDVEEFNEDMW